MNKNIENRIAGKLGIRNLQMEMCAIIGTLVLIICVGLGMATWGLVKGAMKSSSGESLQQLAVQGGEIVEKELQGYMDVVETIASMQTLTGDAPAESKMAILQSQKARMGYIRMTLVDLNGQGLTTEGKKPDLSEREYFRQAVRGKKNISDPIVSKNDNSVVVVIAVPILNNGDVKEVLTATVDGKKLSDIAGNVTYGKTGKAFMLNSEGTVIANSDYSLVKKMVNSIKTAKSSSSLVRLEKNMIALKTGAGEYTDKGIARYMGYAPVPGTTWSIAVAADESEVLSRLNSMAATFFIVGFMFYIVSLVFAFMISRWISSPITALTELISKMAVFELKADDSEKIDRAARKKNEIGIMARAILHLRREFYDIISGVRNESHEVQSSVDIALSDMEDLNQDINLVSTTTEQLSAGMEETAASTQEMNATSTELETAVESIAFRAQEGADLASEVSRRADELRKNFTAAQQNTRNTLTNTSERLNKALEESKSVEQINALSDTIMQITAQTNLLALNAAIEAARAGEAGKGFAVVAEEIRKLAEDSKTAVMKIQEVIKTVIASVGNLAANSNDLLTFVSTGVEEDYKRMLGAADQYNDDASAINNMIMDFSATSEELLASIQNMMKAIGEITSSANEGADGTVKISEKTTDIVGKAGKVVTQVNKSRQSADKLMELVSKFKV